MQLLDLSLAYLLQEIKPLITDSYINRIQELSADKFKFKLRTKKGVKNLFFFPNSVFFSDYKIDALKQTSGFGAFLRKRIEGKKILSVKQHNFDRILEFELPENFLIIELFLNGNIILTDKNFQIISALRKEETKNRIIAKNTKYFFPVSGKLNPKEMLFNEFKEKFQENFKEKKDLIFSLVSAVEIAPIFAEEVFFKLKTKKEAITEKELKKVFGEVKKLYSLEIKPEPIKAKTKKEETVLPFVLDSVKNYEKVPSINSALDDFYSKQLFSENAPQIKPKKLIALEHSFKQQKESEERLLKEIQENKNKAETIYSNNLLIEEIISAAKKGFASGLKEKEIMQKINSYLSENNKKLSLLSLSKNKVLLELKEN
ncbi:NFACT family protein [Candidatus Micrarchaeota archaeon]|nr:NFACT family protein [Candidatus Micrarchaeota archaeon]